MRKFVKIDKEAMAQGYLEMSELNLSISNECQTAEEEGWGMFYEMATKEMDGQAE